MLSRVCGVQSARFVLGLGLWALKVRKKLRKMAIASWLWMLRSPAAGSPALFGSMFTFSSIRATSLAEKTGLRPGAGSQKDSESGFPGGQKCQLPAHNMPEAGLVSRQRMNGIRPTMAICDEDNFLQKWVLGPHPSLRLQGLRARTFRDVS